MGPQNKYKILLDRLIVDKLAARAVVIHDKANRFSSLHMDSFNPFELADSSSVHLRWFDPCWFCHCIETGLHNNGNTALDPACGGSFAAVWKLASPVIIYVCLIFIRPHPLNQLLPLVAINSAQIDSSSQPLFVAL